MTRTRLPILLLAATIAASVTLTVKLAGTANDPFQIAGGSFEASGVVHVPSSNTVLFVDDGRTREIFAIDVAPDGAQRGSAKTVALHADVTDLEGITTDGKLFYVVGSQSKATGFEGDGLVRFAFDPATGQASKIEKIQGLKKWLAENVAELHGTANRIGDKVLNIEGLAWDPDGGRLLMGLRAPVIDGQALIIAMRFKDPAGPFHTDNLIVDGGKAIRVSLNGAGIRSIEYDASASAFRMITGAGLNKEDRDFRVVEWRPGGGAVREVTRYASRLKPEGITRATLEGHARTVIVFDTGRMAVLD